MSTGWIIGYAIAGALVLVVVVLLLLLIRGASRAVTKAESIVAALEASRDNTAPLWAVNDVNNAIERISGGAAAVRNHLAGDPGAPS
jgi:Na+-transporting methylmalonyl-CoA/oxaloacetate decarboxylase gamma subunit